MNSENRKFLIFNVSELDLVDFSQILETSSSTVRKSVDGTKTFIKWNNENEPSFIKEISSKEGPFEYEEMLNILSSPEWIGEMPNHMI